MSFCSLSPTGCHGFSLRLCHFYLLIYLFLQNKNTVQFLFQDPGSSSLLLEIRTQCKWPMFKPFLRFCITCYNATKLSVSRSELEVGVAKTLGFLFFMLKTWHLLAKSMQMEKNTAKTNKNKPPIIFIYKNLCFVVLDISMLPECKNLERSAAAGQNRAL